MTMISLALSVCNPIYQRRGSPPVITATTAPTLSALTDAQTPADGYTAGSYTSTAGTIASAVETYYVNDVEVASTYDLAADDEVRVSVLVTDSVGNTRTFSTGTVTVTVASGAVTRASLTSDIIAAHNNAGDGAYQGETSTTGFTTYTETTPDGVRSRVETWRTAGATDKIRIICDWNGILDLTTASLRGPADTTLTADAGEFGGYARPAGALWLQAASGKTPVFGNSTITMSGHPRLFVEGIGFAGQANAAGDKTVGDGINNLLLQSSSTFPLPSVAAFKDCTFGLTLHRPAEPTSEYIKALRMNGGLSLHVEDCEFAGCRDQIGGTAKYLRVWRNHARKILSDFSTQFGFTSALQQDFTGHRVYGWIEGNLICDLVDEAGYTGLHTDLYQAGTALDIHAGNSALIRWNVSHQKTSLSDNSGTQGTVYSDDHTTANNSFVVYENINMFNAYSGATFHDPSGAGHFFAEDNLFMRSGDWYRRSNGTFLDIYPQVRINDIASSAPTSNGGTITITGNYVTSIINPAGVPTTESGNIAIDPRRSAASGVRPENVLTGTGVTWTRDGSDTLTYSIANEDSADFATAFYAIVDGFEPVAGWGVNAGPSDPETWSGAPTRPSGSDTTAPTLSSPTGAASGSAGATSLGVTTDEGNGTLYWGIYPTASTPTAAEVAAGTGATVSGSQAVSATGAQAVSDQTGLTPSTAYKAHYVHDDAVSNRSAVATSAEFTTGAATSSTFTTSATGPYFLDPLDLGTVSAITWSGKFRPSALDNYQLFQIVSTGFDVETLSSGNLRTQAEDGGGSTKVVNLLETAAGITAGAWVEIICALDQVAGTYKVRVNGTLITDHTFTPSANPQFPATRELGFLALSGGTKQFVGDVEYLRVWKSVQSDGTEPATTPYKEIAGSAATVNGDGWKLGSDAT